MAYCQSKSFQRLYGVLILMKAKTFTHINVAPDGTFTDGRPGQVEVEPKLIVNRDWLWVSIVTGLREDNTVHGITMQFETLEELENALKNG